MTREGLDIPTVLFVDDEPRVLAGLQRMLHDERRRWDVHFLGSVGQVLERVHGGRVDAVVTDVNMPGRSGFDLLAAIQSSPDTRDIPVIILTGRQESDLKRRALEAGAADLLNKPVDREDLIARIRSVLRLRASQDALKASNCLLEQRVRERTAELEMAHLDIVWRLAKAGESRDTDTGQHVVRVACYSRALAMRLGLPADRVRHLTLASPLHDLGKIGIPDCILRKPGRLTPEEQQIMRRHCAIGAAILLQESQAARLSEHAPAAAPPGPGAHNLLLQVGASIALAHHEWWDGSGYPAALRGESIPLEARIVAVADVYDALHSARPYKPALADATALELMSAEAGRHFDPEIYRAFEQILEEFRAIRHSHADASPLADGAA